MCHTCHAGKPGAGETIGECARFKQLHKAMQPHLAPAKFGGFFWPFVSLILTWPQKQCYWLWLQRGSATGGWFKVRIWDLNSRLPYSYQFAKLSFSYFNVILAYFIIHCHVQLNAGWPDAPAWLSQSLSLIKCPLCICFFLAGFWSHRNLIKFSLFCY